MISALPPSVDPGQGGSGSGGPESAGVPEPASRAMLVAGFGLAGSALRRRIRHPSGDTDHCRSFHGLRHQVKRPTRQWCRIEAHLHNAGKVR